MSRTLNSIKNIKFTLIGQLLSILLSFISRTVFIYYLSAEYLGLNGLFTNIISLLSLAELGVGSAITFSIYKPLANNDIPKIRVLMRLFKKAYIFIGIFMLVAGVLFTPFLGFFIKELPQIENLELIYILFLITSSLTYFFSYKRALIIADQKKYIDSVYHYAFLIIVNIVQIIVLITLGNYILFLLVKLFFTLLENYLISLKATKLYPFLKQKCDDNIDSEEKITIVNNIKALMLHRIGSIIVTGTDNLLISKFVGIVSVGLYSNYLLIIGTLNTFYSLIFQSMTASIGNLGAIESKQRTKLTFEAIDFFAFWLYAFSSIALFNLFNPFIKLWIGESYVFNNKIVFVIAINFFIQGLRKSVLTFRDALGLFWYDRYKPIFESTFNLIFSIYLAIEYGIIGVLLGTTFSTILTASWIEPYVLYKYGFSSKFNEYLKRFVSRVLMLMIIGFCTWRLTNIVEEITIKGFIIMLSINIIVPNICFVVIYFKTKEFKFLVSLIKKFIPIK